MDRGVCGLHSMESQRVRHDWGDLACTHTNIPEARPHTTVWRVSDGKRGTKPVYAKCFMDLTWSLGCAPLRGIPSMAPRSVSLWPGVNCYHQQPATEGEGAEKKHAKQPLRIEVGVRVGLAWAQGAQRWLHSEGDVRTKTWGRKPSASAGPESSRLRDTPLRSLSQ